MNKKIFNILCIDGGGIRGLYSAYILKKINEEFKINFREKFDIISGTSTGSIIASALSIGLPIEEIVNLYETQGKEIFTSNFMNIKGIYKSKYNKTKLRKILLKKFGKITLNEIKILN